MISKTKYIKLIDIKYPNIFFYIFLIFTVSTTDLLPQTNSNTNVNLAGFRASRINSSYPGNVFPDENYWVYVGEGMSKKFTNSSPSAIWIVSIYEGNGDTRIGFPYTSKNILASDSDLNEEYLKIFDNEGIKIFLQVEPGSANIDTLINIILKRYGKHKCVIGFGIDIEWFDTDNFSEGKPVTDSEAQRWEILVKSYNPNYNLFLKHYSPEWMPKNYRGDIIFLDDGQQFNSLEQMKYYFKIWSEKFPNNKVSYQIGYPSDEFWWNNLSDPAKDIGNELIEIIPNLHGLYWVDFSIIKIFPLNITGINDLNISINNYSLMQNYPNPFNPSTTIRYSIPQNSFVTLKIYNVLGEEIKTLVDKELNIGVYEVKFNAGNLASGVYFYSIIAHSTASKKDFIEAKKLILLR